MSRFAPSALRAAAPSGGSNSISFLVHTMTQRITLLFILITLSSLGIVLPSCGEEPTRPREVDVIPAPMGFPSVPYPEDNIPTAENISLGRRLFYDRRLSGDGTLSCASCHYQHHGFADSTAVSIGHAGENGSRNAQSIVNVAYYTRWFWDGRAMTLEDQISTALRSPAEMNVDTTALPFRLKNDSVFTQMYARAFGMQTPLSVTNLVRSLASFCRSLVSGRSRFDRFIFGETSALNESEQRGLQLFFSERTKCSSCHSGFNFSDNQFHSIALHAHYYDRGLFYQTKREEDIGKFRTPSLRNIAESAPYTNEGIYATLEDVVEHYNRGGQPFRFKDTSLIKPLLLSVDEKRDLIGFLRSLSDEEFLTKPEFSNPFR